MVHSSEPDIRFQRIGAPSNAHVGRDFEAIVAAHFAAQGTSLSRNFSIPIGHGNRTKDHRFDLGSEAPAVLVECKSHRWTIGGNSPSAKMTVWNEAMYFFHLAPTRYRKCFCVLSDRHAKSDLSLAAHYLRNHQHLVPDGIEIWELDGVEGVGIQVL
jgi:hypothetical protein